MKNKCCLWVLGLILIVVSVPIESPPEEGPDVKYGQFAEVASTNDDLEDLTNFRNLVLYGTQYYFMRKIDAQLQVCDVVGLTGTTTAGGTNRYVSSSVVYEWVNGIAKVYGDEIYLCGTLHNTENDYTKFYSFWSLDGGVNWETPVELTVSETVTKESSVDIFKIGSQAYLFLTWSYGGNTYLYMIEFGTANNDNLIIATASYADRIIGGYVKDAEYFFLADNPAVNATYLTQYSYNGTAYTAEGSSGIPIASITTWDVGHQLYWKQKNQEFFFNEDIFQTRTYGTSTWTNITDVGTTTNGVVWYINSDGEYIINWIIWKDSIYKVFGGGRIAKIQTYTGNAYVGWDDWFANGADKIYQLDP